MRRLRSLHFSSRIIELPSVSLLPTQVGLVQSLSSPCLLSRLRGHARPGSVSANSRMLVTHPIRRRLGRFSHLFPVRFHVTSPIIHMSHRVTVVSAQEHNALIYLLDHDDTCHGCSYMNHHFFSDCQRCTLTQKVRCVSASVSNRCMSPGFKRFTVDSDN